jgi:hypothetical protein
MFLRQTRRPLYAILDTEIPGHPVRITDAGQRPGNYHAVVARQHSGDPIVVTLRQRLAHAVPPPDDTLDREGYTKPIGSGSAGLGHTACACTPSASEISPSTLHRATRRRAYFIVYYRFLDQLLSWPIQSV